jgi:3,4-dihydroxy 2-butanone 4-phosphate synthase
LARVVSTLLQTALPAKVQAAVDALKKGQPVFLYDADGREEETDIVYASQFVDPAAIRHLRSEAGGLICTTIPAEFHEGLRLPFLSDVLFDASDDHRILARLVSGDIPYEPTGAKPAFGLTINHREVRTGVTDADRAKTITAVASLVKRLPTSKTNALGDEFAKTFRAPGHVFLLNARRGLVEARRGHTELATALVTLAGLAPTATICEMMNGPSGRALPKADAIKYAAQNGRVFLEGTEVIEAWQRKGRAAASE